MHTLTAVRNTALTIRPSGRAVDFVAPDLVRGCGPDCTLAYCRNPLHGTAPVVADNVDEVLQAVHRHAVAQPWPRLANRADPDYYVYDFAPATDPGAGLGPQDWSRVLRFYGEHPRAKGSFLLRHLDPASPLACDPPAVGEGKVRVRLGLLPESVRRVLEPGAASVADRLALVPALRARGYEVDLAFVPLLCYEGWLDDYAALFAQVDAAVPTPLRAGMRYEATLLAHSPARRQRNLAGGRAAAEAYLFDADLQELVGAGAPHELIRYRYELRRGLLRRWRELHDRLLPWNAARFVG